MTRPAVAVLLAAAAALVVTSTPATTQPYHAAAPAAVQVPYYGAVYGPPGGLTKADAARLIELLESIDARLARLEAGGPLAAKAPGADPLAVAKVKCARCHTPATADEKGGGFILLLDGGDAFKPLSAREKARVREAVESGTMPPSGKLSPAERSALSK